MTKYLYLRFKDPATFRNRHYKNYRRAWVLFHCVSLSCRVPSWSCCACVCVFFYRLLHWLLDPVSPAINQLITSPSVLTCLSSVNYFQCFSPGPSHIWCLVCDSSCYRLHSVLCASFLDHTYFSSLCSGSTLDSLPACSLPPSMWDLACPRCSTMLSLFSFLPSAIHQIWAFLNKSLQICLQLCSELHCLNHSMFKMLNYMKDMIR